MAWITITWHLNSKQFKSQYSNVSIIQMFAIQIPTEFVFCKLGTYSDIYVIEWGYIKTFKALKYKTITVGIWSQASLDFEGSKKRLVCKSSGFQMGSESGSPTYWNRDKWLPFCLKSFATEKMFGFWVILFWNGWRTIGFTKALTLRKPYHLKSNQSKRS